MLVIVLVLLFIGNIHACNLRATSNGLICVCNITHCDTVPPIGDLSNETVKIYYTSQQQAGFNVKESGFSTERNSSATTIRINPETFQKIIGFGGSFTDSTGQNIELLPEAVQEKLLESYFGEDGLEYSVCRVPVGGADFSPRAYTLDDVDGDQTLEHFALQKEDSDYKIPFIKKAQALRGNRPLRLFATAWTAPPWMKTNPVWSGFSMLKRENYQLFVDYMIKFFDEYAKQNISFWGVTTGNEPIGGFIRSSVNSMGWTSVDQLDWLVQNFGPTFRNSTHKDIKIIIHDDSMNTLPFVVPLMLNRPESLQYIDGVGTHWYSDSQTLDQTRTLARTDKKDTFMISTEACHFMTEPLLGSWDRAAKYISSIISYLKSDFGGWIDWNMALNIHGGFTHINLPADSPIVLSEDLTEFYKQPMFYAMGHFSKFVSPDSVRLNSTADFGSASITTLAFLRPDNVKVVLVYNSGTSTVPVQIEDGNRYTKSIDIPAQSLNTILYSS